MLKPMGRSLFSLVISLLFLATAGQAEISPGEQRAYVEKNYFVVHELQYDWQVYDRKYTAYVPYLREKHDNVSSASIPVDLNAYQGYEFVFYTNQEVYVFVNAALHKRFNAGSWMVFPIDSLRTIYQNTLPQEAGRSPSHIFLTFYSPSGALPLQTGLIGHRKDVQDKISSTAVPILTVLPKRTSVFNYFLIIVCLFILASYAFLYNLHPVAFNRFYSIKSFFAGSYRDGVPPIGKPLNGINLLFLLNHSFLLALLYMMIREGSRRLFFSDQVLRTQENLLDYLFNFGVIGFLIFFLLIFKYAGTYVLGSLFRLDKVVDVHFFDFIHYSKVFYTLLVPVLVLIFTSYLSYIDRVESLCTVIIIGFALLRILLISFRLNKLVPDRNLYLFSYLCVTELVPLLTGIKLLL
jgi:hypothetical protein